MEGLLLLIGEPDLLLVLHQEFGREKAVGNLIVRRLGMPGRRLMRRWRGWAVGRLGRQRCRRQKKHEARNGDRVFHGMLLWKMASFIPSILLRIAAGPALAGDQPLADRFDHSGGIWSLK